MNKANYFRNLNVSRYQMKIQYSYALSLIKIDDKTTVNDLFDTFVFNKVHKYTQDEIDNLVSYLNDFNNVIIHQQTLHYDNLVKAIYDTEYEYYAEENIKLSKGSNYFASMILKHPIRFNEFPNLISYDRIVNKHINRYSKSFEIKNTNIVKTDVDDSYEIIVDIIDNSVCVNISLGNNNKNYQISDEPFNCLLNICKQLDINITDKELHNIITLAQN